MNNNQEPPDIENIQQPVKGAASLPGWVYFAPYLGRPPYLNKREWDVLGLMAVVVILTSYNLTLFSMSLKQIQAGLGISEGSLGYLAGLVSLGAFPAGILTFMADRLGRRKIVLFSIVALTLLTGATAFSPGTITFLGLQFLTVIFGMTNSHLAYVMVTEELNPENRGWGIGALAAQGSLGAGLALILFGFVNVLPFGWRAFYLIGLLPLFLIPWFRRTLMESARFTQIQEETERAASSLKGILNPVISLVRMYPGRLLAISGIVFLLGFSFSVSGFFGAKYLQEAHGWSPWQYSLLAYGGGFLGIFGSAFAGRLSDRLGRKKVLILFLFLHPLFTLGLFNLSGILLVPLWIGNVFMGMGSGVVLGAMANELFPTSYRSTSSGLRGVVGTFGGFLGFWLESFLFGLTGSHWTSITILAAAGILAPLIVFFLPETSGRTLEDISPEI